jgi:hypothetical protein
VSFAPDGKPGPVDLPFSDRTGIVATFFSVDEDLVITSWQEVRQLDNGDWEGGPTGTTAVPVTSLPPDTPGVIAIGKLKELWSA